MVAAIVGIRKAMDYFPNIFTQRELSWLDDVIPDEQKERFNLNCSNYPWIHGRWAMISLQQTYALKPIKRRKITLKDHL